MTNEKVQFKLLYLQTCKKGGKSGEFHGQIWQQLRKTASNSHKANCYSKRRTITTFSIHAKPFTRSCPWQRSHCALATHTCISSQLRFTIYDFKWNRVLAAAATASGCNDAMQVADPEASHWYNIMGNRQLAVLKGFRSIANRHC